MSCKKHLLVLNLTFILSSLAPEGVCVCQRWRQPDHTPWSTASWCWLTGSTAGLNNAVPKDGSVPEKQWLQRWALLWTPSTPWRQEINMSGALWRELPDGDSPCILTYGQFEGLTKAGRISEAGKCWFSDASREREMHKRISVLSNTVYCGRQ